MGFSSKVEVLGFSAERQMVEALAHHFASSTYIHIYIYIYIYICIHMYVCVYLYTHTCEYTYASVLM